MNRRAFLQSLFTVMAAVPAPPLAFASTWAQPARRVLIQQSPVAGFQYYAGERIFGRLYVSAPLRLVRDTGNKYDKNAVAVYRNRDKLGFVPRADNAAVSQMLDRGERLTARIVKLERAESPWDRIRFEVALDG